jgi:hypothetical protein
MSVAICLIEVTVTSRSIVHRSTTDCVSCVWFTNLVNEEAKDRVGPQRDRKEKILDIFLTSDGNKYVQYGVHLRWYSLNKLPEHTNVSDNRFWCNAYVILWCYLIHGYAVAQWLRHCATNRKIAGSIPDGVRIFHWHNPSSRTMALRSTQPLTEMSTRNVSCG